MQSRCLRCGAELTADTVDCPICAYGDVEDIVIIEAQAPGVPRPGAGPARSSRVFVTVAFLIVVLVAVFVALD